MNNINTNNGRLHDCSGCSVCSAICPHNAISVSLDETGFYKPYVNKEKCTSCGLCRKACYKFDDNISMSDNYLKLWACRSNDASLLKTVTSGGVAYLLSKYAVANGYRVAGVVYDTEKDIAQTVITDTDIEKFKGSKYIQAYTEDAFKSLLNDKSNQKYIVFGTPCQIYALNKAVTLLNKRDNFIFVDLFCHGCPSMLLWQKCVSHAKSVLKTDKFDLVEFRSKKRGWHEFCLYFKSGQSEYLTQNEFGGFYRMFFSDTILNSACADCKLRSTFDYTDIRLGDFWGKDYDTDTKGISATVAVTENGQQLMNMLPKDIFIKEHPLESVVKYQSYGKNYKINETTRNKIIELLQSSATIKDIVSQYENTLPFKSKLKTTLKKATYMMHPKIRAFIRKCMH